MDDIAAVLSAGTGRLPRRAALAEGGFVREKRPGDAEIDVLSRVCELVAAALGAAVVPRRTDDALALAFGADLPMHAWDALRADVVTGDFLPERAVAPGDYERALASGDETRLFVCAHLPVPLGLRGARLDLISLVRGMLGAPATPVATRAFQEVLASMDPPADVLAAALCAHPAAARLALRCRLPQVAAAVPGVVDALAAHAASVAPKHRYGPLAALALMGARLPDLARATIVEGSRVRLDVRTIAAASALLTDEDNEFAGAVAGLAAALLDHSYNGG